MSSTMGTGTAATPPITSPTPNLGAPIVPGEGTAPEPGNGLLHPIQFHLHQSTPMQQPSTVSRISALADTAKGQKTGIDSNFQARDLLFSGSYNPQHQLRGLTNTRGAPDA